MTVPVISFFNNKGGVGKTSLVYHVGWMFADLGYSVVVADLDPQANLSAAFLEEERIEALWNSDSDALTIYDFVKPLRDGTGDIVEEPHVEPIDDRLGLVVGDLRLSDFEDELSRDWPNCLAGEVRAFRVTSSFSRILQSAARGREADVVLMDLGPNLGAINRAALVAASFVVVPLAPDLFSLQGLRNLGPALRRWRHDWSERLERRPRTLDIPLPPVGMVPLGYIVMQHAERVGRIVKAYERWMNRIPIEYMTSVLDKQHGRSGPETPDPNCIARLKHYRSLVPMAQEARKPIFRLKPADGAIGGHARNVADAYGDFRTLSREIARRAALPRRNDPA